MRTIVVLEDDPDLLAVLSATLALVSSVRCVALSSMEELIERRAEVLAADVALLDVNLGPGVPSGIDAYRWLRAHGFRGDVRFLTGHARSHPLVEEAAALADARVLEKPIGASELMALAAGA